MTIFGFAEGPAAGDPPVVQLRLGFVLWSCATRRSLRPESRANASGNTFNATSRFSLVSRARNTSPIPPARREDLVVSEFGAGHHFFKAACQFSTTVIGAAPSLETVLMRNRGRRL